VEAAAHLWHSVAAMEDGLTEVFRSRDPIDRLRIRVTLQEVNECFIPFWCQSNMQRRLACTRHIASHAHVHTLFSPSRRLLPVHPLTSMSMATVSGTETPRWHSCACAAVLWRSVATTKQLQTNPFPHRRFFARKQIHPSLTPPLCHLFLSLPLAPAPTAHCPFSPTVAETRTIAWQEKLFGKDEVERCVLVRPGSSGGFWWLLNAIPCPLPSATTHSQLTTTFSHPHTLRSFIRTHSSVSPLCAPWQVSRRRQVCHRAGKAISHRGGFEIEINFGTPSECGIGVPLAYTAHRHS